MPTGMINNKNGCSFPRGITRRKLKIPAPVLGERWYWGQGIRGITWPNVNGVNTATLTGYLRP